MREIRPNLSVFLRRVRQGETFTVTDHGTAVALLMPLPRADGDPLADLIAMGRVVPGAGRHRALPRPLPAPPGGPTATQTLLAERDVDPR